MFFYFVLRLSYLLFIVFLTGLRLIVESEEQEKKTIKNGWVRNYRLLIMISLLFYLLRPSSYDRIATSL